MDLIFGAGKLDRRVMSAEVLLRDWGEKEKNWGQLYLGYEPITPRDLVVVEDLAVTMLIHSRVAARAATSVYRNAAALDLAMLPDKTLEETTGAERHVVAEVIGTVASWPWLSASVATKTLHKKRPALIPILDNTAIFGAYLNPQWPAQPALTEKIKGERGIPRIREALDQITVDVTWPENEHTWRRLHEIEPKRSRIELFDMVWWTYFSARRAGIPTTQ
jgi:hypothetical protein